MSKSPESPKKYTQKEMAEIEKSRALSDAELLKGGAKFRINEKEEKLLIPTKEQVVENTPIDYPLSKNADEREKNERIFLIEQELPKLKSMALSEEKNCIDLQDHIMRIRGEGRYVADFERHLAENKAALEKLKEKIIKLENIRNEAQESIWKIDREKMRDLEENTVVDVVDGRPVRRRKSLSEKMKEKEIAKREDGVV